MRPHKNVISLFPLQAYSQDITKWINPADPTFDQPLISEEMQKIRQQIYLDHYCGDLSPWSRNGVNLVLQKPSPDDVKTMEETIVKTFTNDSNTSAEDIGYGENFRPYSGDWIKKIANNIDMTQFDNLRYQSNHRAITLDNLHVRALPTEDVYLYDFTQPGQGYPFDNLQVSSVWAGTPVYILMESTDHAWVLISTPACIGWVKNSGIAKVSPLFVNTWVKAAEKNLVAITQTETPIINKGGRFLLTSYVGSVFPAYKNATQYSSFELMIPVMGKKHFAIVETAGVSLENAVSMPMKATPHNFATIMSTLIGRPYGWGNMYFYNDCSAELKSLFTPFGIWLPRHSSDQVTAGKMVDMTSAPPEERVDFLRKTGQRFLTIVYIGGHVFLYVGNYPNSEDPSHAIVMTYQNLWGLSPSPPSRRAVIGQSVLFPLLSSYPEDRSLKSLASKKYFQVAYLNELPDSDKYLNDSGISIQSLNHPNVRQKDIVEWQTPPK